MLEQLLAVKKKHVEMVPHQLKEEEFWTRFFQSQFFHHENKSKDFVECFSQDYTKSKVQKLSDTIFH